ncbi:MAG: DUF6492 family protein [Beijerinckiaceae bacterium]|mgnify:CR=1 FL=1|jgi:hypothetical protein|nr:DUF6492 family protein [Beijerinckiaceae bacterium]
MNPLTEHARQDAGLTISLVTCSFSGDLDICKLLCESVNRFVSADIPHILYVPAQDMHLFQPLASVRRLIRTQESLLPRWFFKLPMPGPHWRKRLHLPRRNIYLTPWSLPVRGWIAQQIMKIAATLLSSTQVVVHVDSDNAFIRPLDRRQIVQDGLVRLYRNPQMVPQQGHRVWHASAGRLLGLEHRNYYDGEYIDQLVVWRRDVAAAMTGKIAEIARVDWRIALARSRQFAEYILYGVYADKVRGLDAAGLFATDQSLCLSRWSGAIENQADENAFLQSIKPHHVACLIQSTIAMPFDLRRQVFEQAVSVAAHQDKSGW